MDTIYSLVTQFKIHTAKSNPAEKLERRLYLNVRQCTIMLTWEDLQVLAPEYTILNSFLLRLFHPLTLILNSFIQNICSLLYSEQGQSVLIEVYKEHSCLVTKNYNLFANKILLHFYVPHTVLGTPWLYLMLYKLRPIQALSLELF